MSKQPGSRQKGQAAPAQEEAPPAEAPPPAEPGPTMEARVASRGGTPQPAGVKRVGKWSLEQLRATDGIAILQNGTNKFDSQKGMLNGGFGTPRNTALKYKSGKFRSSPKFGKLFEYFEYLKSFLDNLQEIPEEIARMSDLEVRLQSGTNKYDSQKGMTGFGTGRDVVRESHGVHRNPKDLQELPEDKILLCEGIVRLQSGTNKYVLLLGYSVLA